MPTTVIGRQYSSTVRHDNPSGAAWLIIQPAVNDSGFGDSFVPDLIVKKVIQTPLSTAYVVCHDDKEWAHADFINYLQWAGKKACDYYKELDEGTIGRAA